FSGDGFSVEGFPAGELDNTYNLSYVNGVKRVSTSPGYQTNCFIGSLVEAVNMTYGVRSNTGATIGTDQNVSLAAGAFVRILDVFAAVGAPAGDYTNARVVCFVPSTFASYVGLWPDDNTATFEADSRFAKHVSPHDHTQH